MMTTVTIVSLGGVDMVTDLPGDLVGDLVAHWVGDLVAHGPGHLALVVLGDLVALPLHVLLADRGVAVANVSGLGRPLANVSKADADGAVVSHSVAGVDELAGLANNSGAVVHLLAGLLAVLGHDVLALLDVGHVHVHHHVVVLMAQLLVDHVI